MSKRIHKAIFERECLPTNQFTGEQGTWQEVAREWIGLTPQEVTTQRGEFIDAAQTKGVRKSVADCCWSNTMAAVDSACRMKLAKPNVVDESEPNSDVNFRIFHIENIVNVKELNRELQFVVVEEV